MVHGSNGLRGWTVNKGQLALVSGPELDYCDEYHCAGDCGFPHNSKERAEYAALVLAAFDGIKHKDNREQKERASEVRRKARNQL